MSGQPPPSSFGTNGRGVWNPRVSNPTSPSPSFMYRPQSPWTPVAPSPPPIISGPRRSSMQSPGPIMGSPMSPTPGRMHAMSPGPQGISGLRGSRGATNISHPRPQWPYRTPQQFSEEFQSPQTQQSPSYATASNYYTPPPKCGPSPTSFAGINGPRPFRPMYNPVHQQNQVYQHGHGISSFQLSPTPSPVVCQTSPEISYICQPSTSLYEQHSPKPQFEYVGVPLEPPQPKSYIIYDDEEEQGPSTAEIIANQSQDYIDEKLAEYQMTILQLQEEQERVQKKTFTNWINSYLSKRIPPLRVDDLINDLRDGTKLIALLEVLSGERLPVEKGRVLRRPHFLSNANTALQFLASKRIKLVNINPADLVDGRPPVVLGLIWTIILYFQIEENSRALEYLGQGISGSVSSLDSVGKGAGEAKAEKWKQGARKTLLTWVTNALPKDIGVEVRDFGASWRDGVAFLALIDAIKANLINLAELKKASNRQRLETAFDVAESKLGIAKLLDAEDVDVPKPDEKSIMTYVAQFLHKYPEPKGATMGSSDIQEETDALRYWLKQKTTEYEPMVTQNSFPRDFGEYLIARSEIDAHSSIYNRVKSLAETQSGFLQLSKQTWEEINSLWQLIQYQIKYWLWLLDSSLPGDLGTVGKWLAEAEKLLMDNEIPNIMNEETASVISRKLEEHKAFFAQLPKIEALFENAKRSPYAQNVPLEQLRNIEARLKEIGPRSAERRIKLKFLEHKCCLIAFLNLVENKMKGWTGKYGTEDKVQQQLEQYKNFVSRNKIFQEFQKAFVDMQQVVDEYKRDGNISRKEATNIDQFMFETEERWNRVSMELKCCQNSLEEVVTCWKNWNSLSSVCEDWLNQAERKVNESEDERLEFFQDIGVWKEKFQIIYSSVTYLIASCQDPIANDLKTRHSKLSERFERLFANTKQYMHAGDILRSRKEYKSGIEKLSSWLRNAESKLHQKLSLDNIDEIKIYGDELQKLASEIDDNEELFKTISRNFQGLIQDLSREEVDKTMKLLKQEKESLVRVRARIPGKLHLIHQLLLQQESLEAGEKEINQWLNEAENILSKNTLIGGRNSVNEELSKIKGFFSRTVYYRSMLESKNKVFQNLLKSVAEDDTLDTTTARQRMQLLNDRFNYVIQNAQQWEQKLSETVRFWNNFTENERVVNEWLTQAETALSEKHIESKMMIESQKHFFENVNESWMSNLVHSAHELSRCLPESEQVPILQAVEKLQIKWQDVLAQAPFHLLKLEFRLDENIFHQLLKDVEKEIHLEEQALNRNEDIESILNRNKNFFKIQGTVPRIEKCLETMKRLSEAYITQMPNDNCLNTSYYTAEQQWHNISNKIDELVQTLQQIPAQWENYQQKFSEMVDWMNSVDRTLKNIVNEVNSMEEFEKEKVVFQKICQEADMKREDMKWLVKTLDFLLSYATEDEANIEQKKLENLIARYKNLIPTIEITMVKTEVFSKCFTYRREVHEVVSLLSKVKEQTANASAPDSLEKVNKMIQEQQYAINQLDHQRPHIMSMLQRGRDLSKDVHAPSFVDAEVRNLETGWNEAYTETVDKLQTLKGTQNVWNEFVDQKNDIFSLLQTAETELRALTPLQTDPKNVTQDLKAKRELNVSLQQASHQLLPKLHALRTQLAPLAASEKRPILEKEVAEVEKLFFNTMEHVKDRVGYLEDYSAKWNNYKTRLAELQEWANKVAPKNIEGLRSDDLTPDERVAKVNAFKGILSEKMKQLDLLAGDASELCPKEGNIAEAKRLKGEIVKLQEVFSAINRNVDHQAQAVKEDLINWQRYQAGIQEIKPLIEDSEIKVNTIVPKPLTLQEAVQLQQNASQFEAQCQEQLDRLQGISNISHQMLCKTNAPDELDALHSRWTAIHENAKQSNAKLQRLVSTWQSFDTDAGKLETWVNDGEKMISKRPSVLNSPHIDKLEKELVKLKSFNNEISEQQAKLVSLGQLSDQIGLHLAPEGSAMVKDRVMGMKAKLLKLSEITRAKINEVSDAIIARQDFNAKMANFSTWMDQLRNQVAQVEEINPESVETSLQVIHALLQEHADKKPSFNAIYDEVKQLSLNSLVEEANALNDSYSALVVNFQNLETNMLQKKSLLEKWNELLGWRNESENHLNYLKHQLEKPDQATSDELGRIIREIDEIAQPFNFWKSQAKEIDENAVIKLKEPLNRGPIIATKLVNDLENKLDNLKIRSQNQKSQYDQLIVRKTKFETLENSLGQNLQQNRAKLSEILKIKPNLNNIDQIIEDLITLNEAIKCDESLKEKMHDEGSILMREDIANLPAIQEVLLIMDKNYDVLQQDILDRIQKYNLISQSLKEYADSKDKFKKELKKAEDLYNAIPKQPSDEVELHQAAEKTRRSLDQIRKSKMSLDELERKGNNVGKLFISIGEVIPVEVVSDITEAKGQWQNLHDKASKNAHQYETETVIWSQIEDAKKDLLPWLSETNQGLCDAADNTMEIEFGPMRLNKYRSELPSYLILKDNIAAKTEELLMVNNGVPIPALTSLNNLLDDQFSEVEANAERLDSITTSFNEKEQEIRKNIKTAGENLSKLRENLVKCDDMSGDNSKIMERLQLCKSLKVQLDNNGSTIDNLKQQVDELRILYPTFNESIIPKELNNVQKRFETVNLYGKKIEKSLLQFLKKFHADKVGMLKRMITTQQEKVAWCQPETSSDKYNLDVKKSSLQEVNKAMAECQNRYVEILKSLEYLRLVDSPENIGDLEREVKGIGDEMNALQKSFSDIKNILDENFDLWSQYEEVNEQISSWLREVEGRAKVETSNQISLPQIEMKLSELQSFQQEVQEQQPKINNLEKVSQLLVEKNPEARIGQFVNHLVQRYQAIVKSLATYIDRVHNADKYNKNFKKAVNDFEDWYDEAKIEFQELARMGSPGSSSATAQQLETVKNFLKTFDNGQMHLNNAVDIGEVLYPMVTPINRDSIRSDLRKLRESYDYLRDEANALMQQVEAVLIQKTSIEESCTQVSNWLNESRAKITNTIELYPTLVLKKAALQNYKILQQEVELHKNALKQLRDKAVNLCDDNSERRADESIQEYTDMSKKISDRISVVNNQVLKHEAYDQVLEKAQDWLNTIKSEAIDILNETTFEKEGAEEKLVVVENLIQQKPEGDSIFETCHKLLETVLDQTHPSGHSLLIKSFDEPHKAWQEFILLCEDSLVKLKQLCNKWDEFEVLIEGIDAWIKNVENIVKNPSLKSTADAKNAYLMQLNDIARDIHDRAPAINELLDQGREIEGETDLNLKLSRLNTRYQTLKNICKENISKYSIYVKDHTAFNKDYDDFKNKLQNCITDLVKNNEIVGDFNILQQRQNKIREMSDNRINDSTVFEALIDSGEKLYSHTSPDGREIIRQQLRSLRTMWDNYTDDLNSSMQKIDQCLLQFNEFTIAQEQLTKWLKDVDKVMQSHTELKTTLQEKRAQLQNHKLLHQEITTHNILVDNVCDKAQTLVDQIKDTSLNNYLESIKQLFNNIVTKSEDILSNLDVCAEEHAELNNIISSGKLWIANEKEKLLECDDAYGEKADIKRKLDILARLKDSKPQGEKIIAEIREQFKKVKLTTSEKGNDILQKEIEELETTIKSHFNDIDGIEGKQKDVLNQWNNFEKSLEDLTKWCRSAENVFRDQQLQSTIEEKAEQCEKYKSQRDLILQKEKEIDTFADTAHALLNNSGTDRLKNLTSQITNRYHLLQVLSKEVVNRWQNLVHDHQIYNDKLNEISLWLEPIEKQLQKALKDEPSQTENILSVLLSEKEQAANLLASLNTAGEKALPETSTQGREKIRQQLRDVHDRWDKLDEGIRNLQKRQEAQSVQLSTYQDIYNQVINWLDSVEKSLSNENPNSWTSAQEIRSKIFKYKSTTQDINSHRRIIEAINEKAASLLETSAPTNSSDIKTSVSDINNRYERVVQNCAQLLNELEKSFDVYQQFTDLQKSQQDYQKNLWDRLTGYSDYSGNKVALQIRLNKVTEIQDTFPEGLIKLEALSAHIEKNTDSIPARSKEVMIRDLANLNADFEKFSGSLSDVKSSLENRIQQWIDYEINLDRLINWLGEAENSLKNYNPKSTLEEKMEQLSRFQSLTQNLRRNEAEFEKIKDDSSELIQSSGETRISVNVQQVSSRFQSIQATAKEILKKCEQSVNDHQLFDEKYKNCSDWLANAQAKYDDSSDLSQVGCREDLLKKQIIVQELLAQQPSITLILNGTMELGEKCYPTTASEGREAIRSQLDELQRTFDQLFDDINVIARKIQDKMSKWSGFDEIAEKLKNWLNDVESQLSNEIELKTTLDEKRAKLQVYRDILNDIMNHKVELSNLQEISSNLPEKTDHVDDTIKKLNNQYLSLRAKNEKFVERYEDIVSDHQQYCKAVMDAQEFIEATGNTVNLWGDLEIEQVSLHTNLDRLKNLKANLGDEFPRVDQVRVLGEKVIPGTVDIGQVNIRSQIDNTQQEWESLLASINSTIEAIETRLQQWSEFEQLRNECLNWIRDSDNKLHAIDLKETLNEKKVQLDELKSLQGEVRAKELEIDNVSEKGQLLVKGPSNVRSLQGPELVTKYQHIFHKVKELNNRWHQYVTTHQEFDNQIAECSNWIDSIKEKLDYCSDTSTVSQTDLENKLSTIQDLILCKEEGSGKIQGLVELAQSVLANTAPGGHEHINKALTQIQEAWSSIALRMIDVRASLDDSISQWSGFLEQVQNVRKTNDWLEDILKELSEFQTTMTEKRAQLDRIKNTEEKVRMEKIDVDALKAQIPEMLGSGQQSQQAFQAQKVLTKFDELSACTQKLLSSRHDQYRDHRLYKEAYDDLVSWISRAREKFPSLKQSSLSDKLAIENAVQATEALINKQAQGELLVEHLVHTGEVVLASTSPQGQEIIRNDIRALRDSFEGLFREIIQQKENLETTMMQWRLYKEEYERLMEWLQQIDILVKNHKLNLLPSVEEKKKQVDDMHTIMGRLQNGKSDVEKFNQSAAGLLKSHLDTYVNNQLRHLNSMYQVQVNLANDVLKKVETNHEQHMGYNKDMKTAQSWIENAKEVIRSCSEASSANSKEVLQQRLAKIQDLIKRREEGQNLVHTAINNGEKVVRNTRSDGKDAINSEMRDLQNDWERLVKKMSTAKVHLETSLLQWADYSSSYSQLQQWISDREAKLQQACEQKIVKSRKGQPGLSSGLSERKAYLRQTNNIVQDIVSFEPMIQSVASKASDLQQGAPATEISNKYETLSKQAKDLYEKQRSAIEQYQALIDAGNEFAQWLRNAKERLSKCAEPTGDKQSLAEKTHQLKILQSEVPDGQKKLDLALEQGEIACKSAEPADREIIEEEVALLQEEFDSYVDALKKAKEYLEVGIVKWTDYQEQYTDALEWLTKTEALVQSYNKLQDSLGQKKVVLEEFQGHLQTLFDWQKELDRLNMKAQILLETCSDTRISNAITQLTTKYNALLTLAKEVMRRLEMHYQEHQQHHTIYEECQSWIEKTREKLNDCELIPGNLKDVQIKLNTVKNLRQGFETGQNKLRYLLELKEKVIMNTEQNGAAKIQEDTENLKQDFEKLLIDLNDVKQRLTNRASQLDEVSKLYKVLLEWMEDIEPSIKTSDDFLNDLSEKRAALEKYRAIYRDITGHSDLVEKINKRLEEDKSLEKNDFMDGLKKFDQIQETVGKIIENLENQVNNHDKYKQAVKESQDWLRKTRIAIEQSSDSHGERDLVEDKLNKLGDICSSIPEGKTLLDATVELSQNVIATSSSEGQDAVAQEIKQLSMEWETLQALSRDARSSLEECLSAWDSFLNKFNTINHWITDMTNRVATVSDFENKTPNDLVNAKKILEEVLNQRDNVEDLNDACEILMEQSACSRVRDQTIEIQATYTKLLTAAQGVVAKIEKNLSDHTEFLNFKTEMDAWTNKANEILNACTCEGDIKILSEQLDIVNSLYCRLPEGQHLLNMVQEAYNRASNITPEEQQEKLRNLMTKAREDWDILGLAVKQKLSDLNQAQTRWTDFSANKEKLKKWIDDTENVLRSPPDTKGELSEMKTILERFKSLMNDIKQKTPDVENLVGEANNLGTEVDEVKCIQNRFEKVKTDCINRIKSLEGEIIDYNSYHQSLQDVEKWLLQISFQLMAHNSLFISNREQTQEQINQHEALLDEIQKYMGTLDDLNAKGQGQIKRYESTTPSIREIVEGQLSNIQDSYNSLLHTSVQIKNRLHESLAKFQDYEDTLSSILSNLNNYEPIIQTELDIPATNLEMAKKQLSRAQELHNKLQQEKSRLALAVQACEAATASISRPSSPLETAMQPIPEKELIVRAKLEDLLDQIQSHLSGLSQSVGELEEQQKQRSELQDWIKKQENSVSDWLSRPCKLRPEAAKQELAAMNDILNTIENKRSQLLTDMTGSFADDDTTDLEENLDKLEAEFMNAIAKKQSGQNVIDDYRQSLLQMQNWFDSLIKRMDVLDKGSGLTCGQKMTAISELKNEFEENGPIKFKDVKDKAAAISEIISNLDGQQVEEQMKSLERRYNDIGKRIDRKAQLLDVTNKSVEAAKAEIDQLQNWAKEKLEELQSPCPIGFEVKSAERRHQEIKGMMKDTEAKQSLAESLEKRTANLQPELEPVEYQQLVSSLRNFGSDQRNLSNLLKSELERALEAAKSRRALETDFERARAWLKSKLVEVRKLPGYHPLYSVNVEKEIQANKRYDDDIKEFNEGLLSDVIRQANIIMKDCPAEEKIQLQKSLDELESDNQALKDETANRMKVLVDILQNRRNLEDALKNIDDWLNEVETTTSVELRKSNLPILEEQLNNYQKLAKNANKMGESMNNVSEQAKSISATLSNPDKLKLNEELKNLKDRLGKINQVINDRVNGLTDNIRKYKDAKNKLADCMQFLGSVQQRLRDLNKPIGSKIEDVQDLLGSYEDLLKELKDSKSKMGDMHFDDLPELQSILSQQDDMIKLIEDQLAHLRQLLLLREQFIALINQIITFIMKYTEVITDIENSPDNLEEKINKYDDVIVKIQECEAVLAAATDKGQKIASEGTAADRNSITEQLQSLKKQLQNLRKAVETQKQKHQNQLEHHKKMASELSELLDWLHSIEGEVKTRPLLDRDPDSVEHEIQKHNILSKDVKQNLDKISKIINQVQSEIGMPSALIEMMSEGRSLVASLPSDLDERLKYLTSNKDARIEYMKLISKFNAWVHEAETRLQNAKHGINYENLMKDIEEHKTFFGNESGARKLVHKDIQDGADNIWPSLSNFEQNELSRELQEHQQTLDKILTTAKTQQNELEKEAERWKIYNQYCEKIKAIVDRTNFVDEPVTNLAGVHFNIQKLSHAIGNIESQSSDIVEVNQQAQAIIRQADSYNREKIEKSNLELNRLWTDLVNSLESRREKLQNAAEKWEEFENKFHTLEKSIVRLEEKLRNVDPVVRSRRHLEDTKHAIQETLCESEELKPSHKEIEALSKSIVTFLGEIHKPSAEAIRAKVDNIVIQNTKLNDTLKEKEQSVSKDLEDIENYFRCLSELQDRFNALLENISEIHVFDSNVKKVENDLEKTQKCVDHALDEVNTFIKSTQEKYIKQQNLIPSDITQEFTALELLSERVQVNMDAKQRDYKRAKTVRTEYLTGVDEIQTWLQKAEIQIQDRSLEPAKLKEDLHRINQEIGAIYEKFNMVKSNGAVIIENCRNNEEKLLVQNTIDQLAQQLGQVKSWLDEKKQQVGDSVDAWTRFMNLYQIVMSWVTEKRAFLEEPLDLKTLHETRQKLNDYSNAVKSIKPIVKHLGEMDKELEHIGQVTTVGDLKDKLQEAEEAKIGVEAVLLERNALLQETSEEWDQCERKIKDIRSWIEKTKASFESTQQKKKPLRDQLGYCEKTVADINVQKTKLRLSIEKLEVHFRSGIGGDPRLSENVDDLLHVLSDLNDLVKLKSNNLEETLSQIDVYQQQMQSLRQKIIQEEQQLRLVMAPTYLPHDREQALVEQQACRERVKNLYSKITSRSERIKLLIHRGTPDDAMLDK